MPKKSPVILKLKCVACIFSSVGPDIYKKCRSESRDRKHFGSDRMLYPDLYSLQWTSFTVNQSTAFCNYIYIYILYILYIIVSFYQNKEFPGNLELEPYLQTLNVKSRLMKEFAKYAYEISGTSALFCKHLIKMRCQNPK